MTARETVVLVETPSEQRAARARALRERGAVVFTVDDTEAALDALTDTRDAARVVLVDVPPAAEAELREALRALATLYPVAVDARRAARDATPS